MELRITINQAGQVQVHGPINDPILCYGLLEMAKQVIAENLKRVSAGGGVEIASGPQAQELLKSNGRY